MNLSNKDNDMAIEQVAHNAIGQLLFMTKYGTVKDIKKLAECIAKISEKYVVSKA